MCNLRLYGLHAWKTNKFDLVIVMHSVLSGKKKNNDDDSLRFFENDW